MYNFGVPSTLKAYFDHVARAGVTFRYTANGPEGLLHGQEGLRHRHARRQATPGTPQDLQSAYVRQFLGFIGITDVEFVYAEGLALGEDSDSQRARRGRQAHRTARRLSLDDPSLISHASTGISHAMNTKT